MYEDSTTNDNDGQDITGFAVKEMLEEDTPKEVNIINEEYSIAGTHQTKSSKSKLIKKNSNLIKKFGANELNMFNNLTSESTKIDKKRTTMNNTFDFKPFPSVKGGDKTHQSFHKHPKPLQK